MLKASLGFFSYRRKFQSKHKVKNWLLRFALRFKEHRKVSLKKLKFKNMTARKLRRYKFFYKKWIKPKKNINKKTKKTRQYKNKILKIFLKKKKLQKLKKTTYKKTTYIKQIRRRPIRKFRYRQIHCILKRVQFKAKILKVNVKTLIFKKKIQKFKKPNFGLNQIQKKKSSFLSQNPNKIFEKGDLIQYIQYKNKKVKSCFYLKSKPRFRKILNLKSKSFKVFVKKQNFNLNFNLKKASLAKKAYFQKKQLKASFHKQTSINYLSIYNHFLLKKNRKLQIKRLLHLNLQLNLKISRRKKLVGKRWRWRKYVPKKARFPFQRQRITKKLCFVFRWLKKFNNQYKNFYHFQKNKQYSWSFLNQHMYKTSFLLNKKKKRLLMSKNTNGIVCLKSKTKTTFANYVFSFQKNALNSLKTCKIKKENSKKKEKGIIRFKRKYLLIKGFYRKYTDYKLEFLIDKNVVYNPIQIKYKKINLLFKHRPIHYYFAEMNLKTLETILMSDVDFYFFPYKSILDFKTMSHLYKF